MGQLPVIRRRPAVLTVVVSCLVTAACGSGTATKHVATKAPAPVATTAASIESTTTVAPATSAPLPATTSVPHEATEAPTETAAPDPGPDPVSAPLSLPAQLAGVSGGQAIIVTAPAYGATTATLTAYQRSNQGWQQVFGPWDANVGENGVAAPGEKTEGDGMTPSGSYGFDFAFGVNDDPGTQLHYRQIASPSIVWVEDPDSPLYNEWVDTDSQDGGADAESMLVTPAYDYGAVIAYNDERAPGAGSAIFLHVSTGGPTAGCVSVPEDELLQLLTWLDPARDPRIVIGVG